MFKRTRIKLPDNTLALFAVSRTRARFFSRIRNWLCNNWYVEWVRCLSIQKRTKSKPNIQYVEHVSDQCFTDWFHVRYYIVQATLCKQDKLRKCRMNNKYGLSKVGLLKLWILYRTSDTLSGYRLKFRLELNTLYLIKEGEVLVTFDMKLWNSSCFLYASKILVCKDFRFWICMVSWNI